MGRDRLRRAWVVPGALALLAASGRAQAPADSVRLVRAMHEAQAAFEWHRRMNLPWTGGGGSGGACDARIGRFCYWHGVAPDTAPPEPRTIVAARDRLIARLDSAAARLPGDGWIAGQRVRYLLEAHRDDEGLRAARACRAARWWCDALAGLVSQESEQYAAAGSTYDRALREMPDTIRCRWTDLAPLLAGSVADRYRHIGCGDRAPFNARLWWLAQPFYSLGANDRRTEHFARRTMIRILRTSAWPVVGSWGDDARDLILRYGWPRWFEGVRPDIEGDPDFSVIGHEPQPSFAFFPNGRLLDSVYHARPDDWDLEAGHAASRYAPAYLDYVEPVSVQISRFERTDSMLVVAAYDATGDTLIGRGPLRGALVVMPDEQQTFIDNSSRAGASGAFLVTAPRLPALASLELLDSARRAGARYRTSVSPRVSAPGIDLSDLLFFHPGAVLPTTLREALATAFPAVDVRPGPIGLYWELYGGLDTRTTVSVSLTVRRTGGGWWQQARRFLHLGGASAPVALRWQDVVRFENGVAPRAVSADLSRLDAGTYVLRLAVSAPGAGTAVDERTLAIRR